MSLCDFQTVKVGDVILPQKCLYSRMINGFYVPCGKCEFCLRSRAREWSFRLEAESFDKYVYNVLLTYKDESLSYYDGFPTVNKVHVQQFLKRFRYYVNKHFGTKVKYFLSAEYGGNFHRPHYHMILFSDKKLTKQSFDPYSFIQELLDLSWGYGYADIEPLNNVGGSVHYLTAYMTSMSDGRVYNEYTKPFLMMSRCGLGKSWIDKHPNLVKKMIDEENYTYVVDNKVDKSRVSLPRYLRRKIMPECHQIARADAYSEYCKTFQENFNNLNYEQRNNYFKELKKQRQLQRVREHEQYRKGKVHANNANTSKLSNRAKKSEVKKTS